VRARASDAFPKLLHEFYVHQAEGPRQHQGVDLHHRIRAVLNFTVQQVQQLAAVPPPKADAWRSRDLSYRVARRRPSHCSGS
jgi:hypothetical protein